MKRHFPRGLGIQFTGFCEEANKQKQRLNVWHNEILTAVDEDEVEDEDEDDDFYKIYDDNDDYYDNDDDNDNDSLNIDDDCHRWSVDVNRIIDVTDLWSKHPPGRHWSW